MTLNERIRELEEAVKILISKINDLSQNIENKDTKPYSEVSLSTKLDNMDGIWINGIWRNFAIYKDEE